MDHKRGVKELPKPPHAADGAPLAPKLLQAVHVCPVRDPAVFGGWGAALLVLVLSRCNQISAHEIAV